MREHYPDSVLVSAIRREEDEIRSDEKRFSVIIGLLLVIILLLIGAVLRLLMDSYGKTAPVAAQTIGSVYTIPLNASSSGTGDPVTEQPAVQSEPSTPPQVVTTPAISEYFISFGTGSNQSADWTDVPGALVTVDFGGFRTIEKILFEANISIPTANETASVRLFNVTDKHPVWNSELTTTNNAYAVSAPLSYDMGEKTYQIQMKTQLRYMAELTQARIHIFLR